MLRRKKSVKKDAKVPVLFKTNFDSLFDSMFKDFNLMMSTVNTKFKTVDEDGRLLIGGVDGYGKDDISITYDGKFLRVHAKRKDDDTTKSHFISYTIKAVPESIEATFKDDLLTITYDKIETPKIKNVVIK